MSSTSMETDIKWPTAFVPSAEEANLQNIFGDALTAHVDVILNTMSDTPKELKDEPLGTFELVINGMLKAFSVDASDFTVEASNTSGIKAMATLYLMKAPTPEGGWKMSFYAHLTGHVHLHTPTEMVVRSTVRITKE